MRRLIASTIALAIALAGCATGPRIDSVDRLALLRAHAGEPVNSILHPGRLSGWSPVGTEALVLHTHANRAYLLELTGPCTDLPHAHAIGVTSRGGTIASRFDSVTPAGPGLSPIQIRCHIKTIRPLDVAAVRKAEREALDALREAAPVEREDDAQTPAQ